MMDGIYWYRGAYPRGSEAEGMVRICAEDWLAENREQTAGRMAAGDAAGGASAGPESQMVLSREDDGMIPLSGVTAGAVRHGRIVRAAGGKPFFASLPIWFSVSDSDALWMCMVSASPCGLDVQKQKSLHGPRQMEKLARRFFREEEAAYAAAGGPDAFYRIWTRREAFAKLTGNGLFGAPIPPVLEDEGIWEGQPYYFRDVPEIREIAGGAGADYRCAAVSARRPDIVLKKLTAEMLHAGETGGEREWKNIRRKA